MDVSQNMIALADTLSVTEQDEPFEVLRDKRRRRREEKARVNEQYQAGLDQTELRYLRERQQWLYENQYTRQAPDGFQDQVIRTLVLKNPALAPWAAGAINAICRRVSRPRRQYLPREYFVGRVPPTLIPPGERNWDERYDSPGLSRSTHP